MRNLSTDVLVIGGGPAGLAAAIAAQEKGAHVLLLEREKRLGGILKQCIHDGFGLVRYEEKLSGPEYVGRFIDKFKQLGIDSLTQTFVTKLSKTKNGFQAEVVNTEGVTFIDTKSIVLATGCRERTARQVFIHGTRPAGVFTAGTAQHFINLLGEMPTKRCVILGSGDIGLIMARRLTLEGAEVVGVYEVKPTPSGLQRNIHQCLNDFNIPLHLSMTVTKVYGNDRLEAVEVAKVDENMQPIAGTEEKIPCDALILSVGLIPENEIAEQLGVKIDPHTKGAVCNENLMTSVPGVFACGNCLHVNDLVDYVSESGECAGAGAAKFALDQLDAESDGVAVKSGDEVAYIVPQRVDRSKDEKVTVYFRCKDVLDKCKFQIKDEDGTVVFEKKYPFMRPPEMERLEIDFAKVPSVGALTAEIEVTAK